MMNLFAPRLSAIKTPAKNYGKSCLKKGIFILVNMRAGIRLEMKPITQKQK